MVEMIILTLLGGLVASQFFIYYRLGSVEQKLEDISNGRLKKRKR